MDDGSDNNLTELEYLVGHGGWGKVRLLHTGAREGLIRARIAGARNATADSLVFLDSHVECNTGWLEPLMQRLRYRMFYITCYVFILKNFIAFYRLRYTTLKIQTLQGNTLLKPATRLHNKCSFRPKKCGMTTL